jgi:hypothetical protein
MPLTSSSLNEWEKYFAGLSKNKQFKRCKKFPSDPAHIHFSEGACIECYLLALSNQTVWKTGFSSQTKAAQPTPAPPVPTPKEKSSNVIWLFWKELV